MSSTTSKTWLFLRRHKTDGEQHVDPELRDHRQRPPNALVIGLVMLHYGLPPPGIFPAGNNAADVKDKKHQIALYVNFPQLSRKTVRKNENL